MPRLGRSHLGQMGTASHYGRDAAPRVGGRVALWPIAALLGFLALPGLAFADEPEPVPAEAAPVLPLPPAGAAAAAAAPDTCYLLTSPARHLLSGAAETFLSARCGETSAPPPPVPTRPTGEEERAAPDSPAPRKSAGSGAATSQAVIVGANKRVNDPSVDTGSSTTQSEATIAATSSTVAVACNDSNASFIGWGTSTDEGSTWTDRSGFPWTNGGDPELAADASGYLYFAFLSTCTGSISCIGVVRSTDGGATWPTAWGLGAVSGRFQDKPWLVADPAATGKIYLSWTDYGTDTRIRARGTTDFGSGSFGTQWTLHTASVQGSSLAVGPGGWLYAAWWHDHGSGAGNAHALGSTDWGGSWLTSGTTATFSNIGTLASSGNCAGRYLLNGDMRVNDFPRLAVDRSGGSFGGRLYLAYNASPGGGDQADVRIRASDDAGVTWDALGSAVKINDDSTTNDQWFPTVAVDASGNVGVVWYDRRRDGSNSSFDVYMSTSSDGGSTWWPNRRVTTSSSGVPTLNPNFDPAVVNCYMGDYNDITAKENTFYMAWGDNRDLVGTRPDPNVYFAAVDASPNRLLVPVVPKSFAGGW